MKSLRVTCGLLCLSEVTATHRSHEGDRHGQLTFTWSKRLQSVINVCANTASTVCLFFVSSSVADCIHTPESCEPSFLLRHKEATQRRTCLHLLKTVFVWKHEFRISSFELFTNSYTHQHKCLPLALTQQTGERWSKQNWIWCNGASMVDHRTEPFWINNINYASFSFQNMLWIII